MRSPITGANNVELLYTVSPKDIACSYKQKMGISVGDDFLSIPVIQYWRCRDTGLHWYSPKEAAGHSELYSQLEKLDWYYDYEKWEFSTALGLMRIDELVLEVGVGFGYFLERCRSQGFDASGVELNSSAAKRARDKGFNIYEIDLETLAKKIGRYKFDVICSFQVLEHVSDPGDFITGMLKNIKLGGRLILSVPNAEVMRRVDPNNTNLLNMPPHHMSHWDASVFQSLEDHFPIKVLSIHREPMANYHVRWLIPNYLRNILSPFGRITTRLFVNRISVYLICLLANLGFRKFLPGHTLLVELEKVG